VANMKLIAREGKVAPVSCFSHSGTPALFRVCASQQSIIYRRGVAATRENWPGRDDWWVDRVGPLYPGGLTVIGKLPLGSRVEGYWSPPGGIRWRPGSGPTSAGVAGWDPTITGPVRAAGALVLLGLVVGGVFLIQRLT